MFRNFDLVFIHQLTLQEELVLQASKILILFHCATITGRFDTLQFLKQGALGKTPCQCQSPDCHAAMHMVNEF